MNLSLHLVRSSTIQLIRYSISAVRKEALGREIATHAMLLSTIGFPGKRVYVDEIDRGTTVKATTRFWAIGLTF